MAHLRELPLTLRIFLRTYPWRRIDPVPWTAPRRPLREGILALVSTAGLVLPGQAPFDATVQGGDWSFREIPDHALGADLIDTHRSDSFDHTGLRADPNLGLPLDRLHELVATGAVGRANRRHFSLMGSITAPGRMVARSAPVIASALEEDGVDAALLVPT